MSDIDDVIDALRTEAVWLSKARKELAEANKILTEAKVKENNASRSYALALGKLDTLTMGGSQ